MFIIKFLTILVSFIVIQDFVNYVSLLDDQNQCREFVCTTNGDFLSSEDGFPCTVLNMILNNEPDDVIKKYIQTKAPPKYSRKFINAMETGGRQGLKWLAKTLCVSKDVVQLDRVLSLSDQIMPYLKIFEEDIYKIKFFIFIDWLQSTSELDEEKLTPKLKKLKAIAHDVSL